MSSPSPPPPVRDSEDFIQGHSINESEPLINAIPIPGSDQPWYRKISKKVAASVKSSDFVPWSSYGSLGRQQWEKNQSLNEAWEPVGRILTTQPVEGAGISPTLIGSPSRMTPHSQVVGQRKPCNYQPANPNLAPLKNADSDTSLDDRAVRSMSYNRMRFYGKLAPANQPMALLMPAHVSPPSLFRPLWFLQAKKGEQSSLVSILSIWNTMMGTSVLAMPWALHQAGYLLGLGTIILMAILCCYTCSIILRRGHNGILNGDNVEFADVVKIYLGKSAYRVAGIFSILTLWGAGIVLWVLMSSFLKNIVTFAVMKHGSNTDNSGPYENDYWNPKLIPIYLAIPILPVMCVRKIDFFTKFNSLGVLSIAYMLFFVLFITIVGEHYAGSPFGGWHMNPSQDGDQLATPSNIFSLTGVLSLSYFIHNGCLSIMRNAKTPENNQRDLRIAFALVCSTYLLIGACFYFSFNGEKDCIPDNFLSCPTPRLKDSNGNDCPCFTASEENYIYVFLAQCFLLLQFITVFPLLTFLIRFQSMTLFFNGRPWPSFAHILVTNLLVLSACILMAVFFPNIGTVLRYCGAVCGLVYVFALPMLVERSALVRAGTYNWVAAIKVFTVILLGLVNFGGQFYVSLS